MMDGYIICGTPRTGSTLLCDLLASTKVAGNPDSFFMRDPDPAWAREWGIPARDGLSGTEYAAACLKAAMKAGMGATGIFGLRLMRASLDDLLAMIDMVFPGLPSDRGRLKAAFGAILYVHLARKDKLAQAISMVKAEQTGLWHAAPDGTELERLSPPESPKYDFDRIASKVAELEEHDAAWQTWFDGQGIRPLRVEYESLSANPVEVVSEICRALGVPEPAAGSLESGVARLADATNLDWVRRYRLDLDAVAS